LKFADDACARYISKREISRGRASLEHSSPATRISRSDFTESLVPLGRSRRLNRLTSSNECTRRVRRRSWNYAPRIMPRNGVVILSPYTFYPERDSAFIRRDDSRGGRLAESRVPLSSLTNLTSVDTAAIVLLLRRLPLILMVSRERYFPSRLRAVARSCNRRTSYSSVGDRREAARYREAAFVHREYINLCK